ASSHTTTSSTYHLEHTSISSTSSGGASSWTRSSTTRSRQRCKPSGSSSTSATSTPHDARKPRDSAWSGIGAPRSSTGAFVPNASHPAAWREADLLRYVLACRNPRPERIELNVRVRLAQERDERHEAPK